MQKKNSSNLIFTTKETEKCDQLALVLVVFLLLKTVYSYRTNQQTKTSILFLHLSEVSISYLQFEPIRPTSPTLMIDWKMSSFPWDVLTKTNKNCTFTLSAA